MKIDDVEIGKEYAVRKGNYGSVGRVKVLAIETIEVANRASFSRFAPPLKRRMARVRLIDGYYQRGIGVPPTAKGTERYVPGRDFLRTWEREQSSKANDERLRAEREAEANAAAAQFADLQARVEAHGAGELARANRWRENSHVLIEMNGLDRLLSLAEQAEV